MGVPFKIVVYAADESLANRAVEAAFKRIEELNHILSDYEDDSELTRLTRTAPAANGVKVSDDLWNVLARSQALAEQTDGAFDVTVGPLVQLWRRARRLKQLPTPEGLAKAKAAVGYQAMVLDPGKKTVRLTRPGMRLDLGGIGIGYAVDEALKVLKAHGIDSAMVDASGDVGVSDAPPGRPGWRIGIQPDPEAKEPTRFVNLKNTALTTSGDAYQHLEIEGERYSHIVDPRTGIGLTDRSSITVIAKDCTTADSLATAVSVLGPKKGLALIAETHGAEVSILRVVGGKPQRVESAGFKAYEAGRSNDTSRLPSETVRGGPHSR